MICPTPSCTATLDRGRCVDCATPVGDWQDRGDREIRLNIHGQIVEQRKRSSGRAGFRFIGEAPADRPRKTGHTVTKVRRAA